ncbi:hypothetical protein Fcan01_12685 [Folsomia candida]|uniref:Uncharacterized protein n=1 Tax=Folsomia candida TaxID=158441 RepID=A0A226E6L4_FOLCA|nr:hypothetical protein Fcan01_12685 [Folsomia candida]
MISISLTDFENPSHSHQHHHHIQNQPPKAHNDFPQAAAQYNTTITTRDEPALAPPSSSSSSFHCVPQQHKTYVISFRKKEGIHTDGAGKVKRVKHHAGYLARLFWLNDSDRILADFGKVCNNWPITSTILQYQKMNGSLKAIGSKMDSDTTNNSFLGVNEATDYW